MTVCPDAFETGDARPIRFNLYQRGPQLGTVVPQTPQNLIAGHGAAQLAAGQTAAGNNQPLAAQLSLVRFQQEAFGGFFHPADLNACHYPDIGFLQGKTQHIHHGIGLIGIGIYPAGGLRNG